MSKDEIEDPVDMLNEIVRLELAKLRTKARESLLMSSAEHQTVETLSRVIYKAPGKAPPIENEDAGAVALAKLFEKGPGK